MKKEDDQDLPCPCGTGKRYTACCKLFHQGQLSDSALNLMRSRYSAYALNLSAYIISTTHPKGPHFSHDVTDWSQKIIAFSLNTQFNKLTMLDFQDGDPFATVTFVAHLSQNKKDASFTEKSLFEKINGKWLYLSGELSESHK